MQTNPAGKQTKNTVDVNFSKPRPFRPLLVVVVTLTGGFDFQSGLSYWCPYHRPKTHRFCPSAWTGHTGRQTDRQADRSIA